MEVIHLGVPVGVVRHALHDAAADVRVAVAEIGERGPSTEVPLAVDHRQQPLLARRQRGARAVIGFRLGKTEH